MKKTGVILFLAIFLISCGGSKDKPNLPPPKQPGESSVLSEPKTLAEAEKNWENSFGIGPVKNLELPSEVDDELVEKGKEVYEIKCTACHKLDKRFIGPAPKDIFKRRTPAWVMNMILNPEEMVQKDPIAKQLLIEYNGSPMANQNLTEQEARAIVEYFRTL